MSDVNNNDSFDMESIADTALDEIKPGVVVEGEIVTIDSDYAYVNVGTKSDGRISLSEFDTPPETGTKVYVITNSTRLTDGLYEFSVKAAEKAKMWEEFVSSYDNESGVIYGKITGATPKGKIVDCNGVPGFLPYSLAAELKGRDSSDELLFAVKSIDKRKRSLLLSRKDYLEEFKKKNWEAFLEKYSENDHVTGKVVKFVEFGAFIRIDGIDALLHRNDMSWRKVFKQRKLLKQNEEREFVILSINREEMKVSLGLKQLTPDPWESAGERFTPGTVCNGTVVTLTNFGAFVELEEGVEGFLSNNELAWTKSSSVNDLFNKGDSVQVKVLDIDVNEKKINISRKLLLENPWDSITSRIPIGAVYTKPVKKIVKFGMFVELEEEIDGLIHISDISWEDNVNFRDKYKAGDEVEFKVLSINSNEQKISCGIKQLTRSPWEAIKDKYPQRMKVEGVVSGITQFGLFVKLEDNVEGLVHVSEVSRRRIESLEEHFTVGDRVNAVVLGVDVDRKRLSLSIKGYDMMSEKEELDRIMKDSKPGTVTLGDMVNLKFDQEDKK